MQCEKAAKREEEMGRGVPTALRKPGRRASQEKKRHADAPR